MEPLINAILVGIGATAIMDIWALLQKRFFNIPPLNYAMVGRWLGHFGKGTMRHQSIMHAAPISGESAIGWSAHYVIGVLFSLALFAVSGPQWFAAPSVLPALVLGVVTVGFPYFLMQPCFGMGIAAAKLPNANTVRVRSLIAHISFGLGLYIAAKLIVVFAFNF